MPENMGHVITGGTLNATTGCSPIRLVNINLTVCGANNARPRPGGVESSHDDCVHACNRHGAYIHVLPRDSHGIHKVQHWRGPLFIGVICVGVIMVGRRLGWVRVGVARLSEWGGL